MTLVRFDRFRELDRLAEQTLSVGARVLRSMPVEALRRGHTVSEASTSRRAVLGSAECSSDVPTVAAGSPSPSAPEAAAAATEQASA